MLQILEGGKKVPSSCQLAACREERQPWPIDFRVLIHRAR